MSKSTQQHKFTFLTFFPLAFFQLPPLLFPLLPLLFALLLLLFEVFPLMFELLPLFLSALGATTIARNPAFSESLLFGLTPAAAKLDNVDMDIPGGDIGASEDMLGSVIFCMGEGMLRAEDMEDGSGLFSRASLLKLEVSNQ
jgi:hypothetical protein